MAAGGPNGRTSGSTRQRPGDRPGLGQQRADPGDARPPRQPDGARLGPHDRRLGRRLHVRVVPYRHLAVVAAERLVRLAACGGSAATPLNANLHYLAGFWILIPLAMLSFTGAWISFPTVFGKFEVPACAKLTATAPGPCGHNRWRSADWMPIKRSPPPMPTQPANWSASTGRPTRKPSGRSVSPAGRTGRGHRGRRDRRREAAQAAPARDARSNHAPLARRNRHGPGLANRDLSRRHHSGAAVDHRHHHLVASAQAAPESQGLSAIGGRSA